MKDIIESNLEFLGKEVMRADSYFKAWFELYYGDKRWDDFFRIAPNYFAISRSVLRDYTFVTLAKLFEKPKRSDINFNKLLNQFQANANLYGVDKSDEINGLVKKHQLWIDEQSTTISKVMTLRDKRLAHYDSVLSPLTQEYDLGLNKEDIELLLNNSSELVNDFIGFQDDPHWVSSYVNSGDLTKLLSLHEKVFNRSNSDYRLA